MKRISCVFLIVGLLFASCVNTSKSDPSSDSSDHDSIVYNDVVIERNNIQDDNIKLIRIRYPNTRVVRLLPGELYYRAYPVEGKVHLIKIKDGIIAVDEEFPCEYNDIAVILQVKDKLLVGINWSGQSKIVTLTDNLKPVCSKIYSYPDGEWTQLDSLSMLTDNTYYAEFRTNCGDCGDGISLYKIKANLNHKIISSSKEAIGEFAE